MTDRTNAESPATTAGAPGAPDQQSRRPGEWPIERSYTDPLLIQIRRERARRAITLGSIRADLDEQPSRQARRAAAKRWCAAVWQMADEEAA